MMTIKIPINENVKNRINKYLKKDIFTECIVWTGCIHPQGYGYISINKKTYRSHRVVWTIVNGEIPEGMVLDHICKNRACCNVNHLRVVTQEINAKENTDKVKMSCKLGHVFDEKNTFMHRDGNRIHKKCRICTNERNKKYRQNKKSRPDKES